MKVNNQIGLLRRHKRIRKKISGTEKRPRLCVHRSHKNLYAQIIDDTQGKTLVSFSTLSPEFSGQKGGNIKSAESLGEKIAKIAVEKGLSEVIFDRGGYLYHGKIKAFADAARKAGLKF
ncbi:50S ribosomal protein L18 [bacterium Unc6]|nr:50S ribosomal protein L18 [bacterium Unc6]